MTSASKLFTKVRVGTALVALCVCSACSAGGSNDEGGSTPTPQPPANAGGSSAITGGNAAPPPASGGGGASTPSNNGGAGGTTAAGGAMALPPGSGGSGGAGGAPGSGSGAGTGGAANPIDPFTGPIDGDPNAPMVSVEGIPCGAPNVGFGGSPPSVKITDRDVVVAYPCAHEGAAVTFFLFIHGTLQEAQKVAFTMNAFPIHQFVDSHNVIVVTPKAVGTQWGNGDNGADLPHLYDVVNWVYDTFGTKFDIRAMWASGGSWGAFYLSSTFACDPMFQDRLRGVRMVVGSPCPACTDRLACIVAEQELEEGGGMVLTAEQQEMKSSSNIGPFATTHGCDGKMKMPDLGPVRHWTWPNCDQGFVHSYYLGPGQHADPWNDPASLMHMVEEIKSIE